MGYHAGRQIVHWGETVPSGMHLRATESFHRNQDAVRVENGLFVEYWKMGRSGNRWKVREITRDGVLARMSLALEPTIKERDKEGSNG
jgi:hypothetical protein